jgi:chordin
VFKIVRVNDSSLLSSSVLRQVRVPSSCLPSAMLDNIVNPDYTLEPEDDVSMPLPSNKCYYDGQLREEYSQWTPVNDTCQICTCYKGQAKCEAVVCPRVDCVNPVLLTGECCRSCLNTERSPSNPNQGRGCNIEGDRFHPAGSTWHPYMPPNGFMVCTTCSCSADSLTVECTREKCPTLNCSPEEAVYPRPLSCCKVCPPKKAIDPDTINDDVAQFDTQNQNKKPTETEVLGAGGCKFRDELHTNGEEWNHRIEPFGYIPCVVCSCRVSLFPKCFVSY